MITAIVDLQFGSTGKGLLAGYLSTREDFDTVVSANMPNAGHTFVDGHGNKWVNKVLPSGVYSPNLRRVMVGPGAVFDIDRLALEIRELRERGVRAPVVVHENAAVLLPAHAETERVSLNSISSTMQGSMAAAVEKMYRQEGGNVAANYRTEIEDAGAQVINHAGWMRLMYEAKNVLLEGSQGYSLGIHSGFYPYCTSRDCTVWRLLSDCAAVVHLNDSRALRVVGSARLHPIRVGHTEGGNSGPCYEDQVELSWDSLKVDPERTTVTGRTRRVFTFSEIQIKEAIMANRVSEIFLNFCNYDPAESIAVRERINQIHAELREENPFGMEADRLAVRWMGFGPSVDDVLETGRYA